MNEKAIQALKGLHPGIFIGRMLQKRHLPKGQFAMSIGEYPQTLGAVTNGKRNLNPALAMKIEEALDLEEGFLMRLQTWYDYRQIRQSLRALKRPDLSKFKKSTFWDTNIGFIDWDKQSKAIIKRVFERGDEAERTEVTRFYGKEFVNKILHGA